MVSRAAKVNCTDVLIVLWAWHLVATPGRAKQAKVKSASLVKALLTTHPQGESWGSFLALCNPTFSPAAGWAPAAAHCETAQGSTHPRCTHLRLPHPRPTHPPWPAGRPAAPGGGQQPSQIFQCASLSVSKVWKFFGVSFSTSDRVQLFWGGGSGEGGGTQY